MRPVVAAVRSIAAILQSMVQAAGSIECPRLLADPWATSIVQTPPSIARI